MNSSKIAKIFQKCCARFRHLGKLQYTDLAKIQQRERSHGKEVIGQVLILVFSAYVEPSQCWPFGAECSDLECMSVWENY